MEIDLLLSDDCDELSLGDDEDYHTAIQDIMGIEPTSPTTDKLNDDELLLNTNESLNDTDEKNDKTSPVAAAPTPQKTIPMNGLRNDCPISPIRCKESGDDLTSTAYDAESAAAKLKSAFGNESPFIKDNYSSALKIKKEIASEAKKEQTHSSNKTRIRFDLSNQPATSRSKLQQQRKERLVKRTSDNLVIDVDTSAQECNSMDGSHRNDNSLSALSSLDETYDMMKVYAPEEDCVSIYSRMKLPDSDDAALNNDNSCKKTVKAPAEKNTIQLVTMLLGFEQSSRARVAAEVFYEFLCSSSSSASYSGELISTCKALLSQLLKFDDAENAQRILKLAVDSKIELGEVVYARVIEFLHQNNIAVNGILEKMSSHQLLSACVASKLSLKLNKQHRTISSTDSPHMKISVSNLESVDDSKPVPQLQCIDENSEYFVINMKRCENVEVKNAGEKFQEAIQNGDWSMAGKCFTLLAEQVDASIKNQGFLYNLVEVLVVKDVYDPTDYISFDLFARKFSKRSPGGARVVKLVNHCLARIAVTLVHLAVPGYAYHIVSYLERNRIKCYFVSLLDDENSRDSSQPLNVINASKFVRIAVANSDFGLARRLLFGHFHGHVRSRADNAMHKSSVMVELLCDIANFFAELHDIDQAIAFLRVLPNRFKGEKEIETISDLLRKVLFERSLFGDKFDPIWLESAANLLLDKNEITLLRRTLSSGQLNSEKSQLFNYLERRGMYCAPRIELRPHLVLIPHTMSLTEMTLSIYRHLTKLVDFLMNIHENLNLTLPLRIVLLRKCGPFEALDTSEIPEEAYFASEERLVETATKLLKPPLRVIGRKTVKDSKHAETMFNVDMRSVRLWFFENTNYQEVVQKSSSGLLQRPGESASEDDLSPTPNLHQQQAPPTCNLLSALAFNNSLQPEDDENDDDDQHRVSPRILRDVGQVTAAVVQASSSDSPHSSDYNAERRSEVFLNNLSHHLKRLQNDVAQRNRFGNQHPGDSFNPHQNNHRNNNNNGFHQHNHGRVHRNHGYQNNNRNHGNGYNRNFNHEFKNNRIFNSNFENDNRNYNNDFNSNNSNNNRQHPYNNNYNRHNRPNFYFQNRGGGHLTERSFANDLV